MPTQSDARINFRLPADLKRTIEEAAALTGQTVSDFAVTTLVNGAQEIIDQHERTSLSNRDRDIFLAMLDEDARPNDKLKAAAKRYKRRRK